VEHGVQGRVLFSGALVDRFAQHCHTMDIDAESWRQKSSLKRNTRAARADD